MAVKDWSTTAASNAAIDAINIAEGCPPSNINNAIRALMASVVQGDWGASAIKLDNVVESTTDAGVTLDSVELKDGNVTIAADLIHSGDTDTKLSFGTNTVDLQTGGSSRLDISDSGVRLGAANARVTTILDEDAMSSDSATALATQQSIKAYVDSSGSGTDVQTFTSSGTWAKPGSGTIAIVECWGAGGSGGRGDGNSGAGGGGGGSYVRATLALSDLGATETVTIGSGGAARSGSAQTGATGGNTTFGSHVTAYGGAGGGTQDDGGSGGGGILSAGSVSASTTGGAGGNPNGGAGSSSGASAGGDSSFGGGGGGFASSNGTAGGASVNGGGGGGGSGSTGTAGAGGASFNGGGGGGGGASSGTAGAGGNSTSGGNGGAGAISTNTATSGAQPSGGGGGCGNGTSGAGGNGQCRVTVI